MNRSALAARSVAILIAIAAIVDPSLRLSRTVPAVVAVLGDSAEAANLERRLGREYQMVHGPLPSAAATIVVGNALPRCLAFSASPVFAVSSVRRLWIDTVIAPASVSLDSRAEVIVHAGTSGAKGSTIEATLASRGLTLSTAQASVSRDGLTALTLPYLAIDAGPASLDLTVRLGTDTAHATVVIDGTDRRWPVLFYDPRPSWMSTFVRRSIEADPRFAVGGRINTSRSVNSSIAGSVRSLSDPALPELYSVIVVGAPDQLTVADVLSLETFARKRGGSVILLFDETPAAGAPVTRLTSVSRWSNQSRQEASIIRAAGDSAALRAMEIATPSTLPLEGEALAQLENRPVVWALPSGAGRVIVSGALDAWRYRDASTSSFDSFWRTTIAAATTSAIPPVVVSLSPRAVRPGTSVDLGILVRDAALADGSHSVTADVTATLDDSVPLTVWPTTIGQFDAHLPARMSAGSHRVSVTANGNSERIDFVVDPSAGRPAPDESALIHAWSSATGGDVVSAERLNAALDAKIPRASRSETLHLMRSPWWMIPFALLLALEWWWRRRRGDS